MHNTCHLSHLVPQPNILKYESANGFFMWGKRGATKQKDCFPHLWSEARHFFRKATHVLLLITKELENSIFFLVKEETLVFSDACFDCQKKLKNYYVGLEISVKTL